jgi:putative zinc finger/helix-turn-helix YgiT family protein
MESQVKCPTCHGTNVTVRRGDHHFPESGLSNVYLIDAEIIECNDCGEKLVPIQRPVELMDCLARDILLKDSLLTGGEIRFIRKNLGLKIAQFAELLDVDRVTVSRWENQHERPSKHADRLIRLAYDKVKKVEASIRDKIWTRKVERAINADYRLKPLPNGKWMVGSQITC